jgi:ribonuclease HI
MVVYTDGAVRHGPGGAGPGGAGPGGAGVYIEGQCEQRFSLSQPLGRTSSLAAEAGAMILGILSAFEMGARGVTVKSDCLILVNTLNHNSRSKCKDAAYQDLLVRLRELITPNIQVEWVPRLQNHRADCLAKEAVVEA